MEHIILGLLVVIEAVISLLFLAWLVRETRGSQERLDAALHGQEHIAELVAEVLRRPRP
jgi:hypothetical protein